MNLKEANRLWETEPNFRQWVVEWVFFLLCVVLMPLCVTGFLVLGLLN